jgi:4-hydroxybenzoate polyprenyltransferase
MLGLKSTAIRFGENTRGWLAGLYALTLVFWTSAVFLSGGGALAFLGCALVAASFVWQIATLDTEDADNCLKRFKANRDVGAAFFVGLLADLLLRA